MSADGCGMPPAAPPYGCPLLRHAGWYHRLFATLLAGGCGAYDEEVDPVRRELLGELHGDVLEIGPGPGTNLPFYPTDVRWVGVEPNPYMAAYVRERAGEAGIRAELRSGVAEALPVPAASADVVVATLVLCSVRDPAAALREVRRVLRPGGRFVFLEHVAAASGSWQHGVQRLVGPFWSVLADGCRPARDTEAAIRAAGFEQLELRRFRVGIPVVWPHLAGRALR